MVENFKSMSKKKKHDINWEKQLPDYAECLNNVKREALGWKSPFEIYFRRKSHELVNAGLTYDGYVSVEVASKPSKMNFIAHEKKRESLRENAQKASDRLDDRVKKSHKRKNFNKLYKKDQKVFVKCEKRRGRKSARHMILVGSFLKRYKDNTNYDIEMEGQRRQIMKRVRIENLAYCPDKTQSKKSIHPLLNC